MYTDPIADLLTRIRNAVKAEKECLIAPYSKIKEEILRILKAKNCIKNYATKEQKGRKNLEIDLLLGKKISLKRISKVGQRVYKKKKDLGKVLGGYGFAVVSTSQGVMTEEEAKKKNLGGEVICEVS
ncbi:MAG TPA: 30S ribosomal protein S8 [Candidatus Peregrinibacteria bacterium]|nr:30S ribosomal protein S8 [Candidatus Peregrinibacteria bacterium]